MAEDKSNLIPGGKFGIDWQRSTSISGYCLAEVRSALVKAIRAAYPADLDSIELVAFFALELFDTKDPSSLGLMNAIWLDLTTVALEDIGGENGLSALQDVTICQKLFNNYGGGDRRKRLPLIAAVECLALCPKSRETAELLGYVILKRNEGWRPEIPNSAIDMHTERGRQMGRGLLHYLTEAAQSNRPKRTSRYGGKYRDKLLADAKQR